MRTEHGKRSQVVIRVLPSAELILEVGSTLWLKHDVFKVRYIAASLRGALLWPSPCFSYDALTIVSLFHVLFVSRFQCKMWNNFTSALHTPGGLFFFFLPCMFSICLQFLCARHFGASAATNKWMCRENPAPQGRKGREWMIIFPFYWTKLASVAIFNTPVLLELIWCICSWITSHSSSPY